MTKESYSEYRSAVRYIESIADVSGKKHSDKKDDPNFFLKRTRYFFDLLGSPDKDLKIIHIAGTSGKGSVSDLVQQQIALSGFKVGLFTSPYATTSIEKIKINNLLIDPNDFSRIVNKLKPIINKMYMESVFGCPSYFEIFFAIAIIYFKESKVDWAVVETGLGGSYDSTNIIEKPSVTAITNIGLDHTEILGKTLSKIARDKSGIAKKNAIFITSEKRPHLLKIMRNIAIEIGVKRFIKTKYSQNYIEQNKILASEILKAIEINNSIDNLTFSLPGRFEIVNNKPLVILDVAHNDDKISATLQRINNYKHKRLLIVFAIASDKNISKTLGKIVQKSDKIFVTRFINDHRFPIPPKDLHNRILQISSSADCVVNLDPIDAVESAIAEADGDDIVLVIGSFYLVGDIRKKWYPEEFILKNRRCF